MIYREEHRDLFSVPEDYYFAQCISADFGMGKGIAVEFNKRFRTKEKLKEHYGDMLPAWDDGGDCFGTCLRQDRVFNLVTKRNYWNKPTYDTLCGALQDMKILVAVDPKVKKIAMPLIGCGLDRLQWDKVSEIIKDVLNDIDIEILVCIK